MRPRQDCLESHPLLKATPSLPREPVNLRFYILRAQPLPPHPLLFPRDSLMPTAQLRHQVPQAERNPQVPDGPQFCGTDRELAEGGEGDGVKLSVAFHLLATHPCPPLHHTLHRVSEAAGLSGPPSLRADPSRQSPSQELSSKSRNSFSPCYNSSVTMA